MKEVVSRWKCVVMNSGKKTSPLMMITLEEHCPAHLVCYYWIHTAFERVFLLFLLLCLITDYRCHLLSSICYCTNDEMNPFKQHLNWWQKPQLLQWLSPLISNHFSNVNQRRSLASTFPPPWKSSNEHWERAPNFQNKPLQASGRKVKRKGKTQPSETNEKGQVSIFWSKN